MGIDPNDPKVIVLFLGGQGTANGCSVVSANGQRKSVFLDPLSDLMIKLFVEMIDRCFVLSMIQWISAFYT